MLRFSSEWSTALSAWRAAVLAVEEQKSFVSSSFFLQAVRRMPLLSPTEY